MMKIFGVDMRQKVTLIFTMIVSLYSVANLFLIDDVQSLRILALLIILLIVSLYLWERYHLDQKYELMDKVSKTQSRYAFKIALKEAKHPRIVILDIDEFDKICDYYGEDVADEVLHKVGAILSEFATSVGMRVFNFRMDKFVILDDAEFAELEKYENLIQKIIKFSKRDFLVLSNGKIKLDVGCTAGLCLDEEEPVKKALMALRKAKSDRRDFLCYFEDMDITDAIESRKKSLRLIKNAILKDKIVPYFQPIFDADKKLVKYETLVRIVSDEGEVILPGVFLEDAKNIKLHAKMTKKMFGICFDYLEQRPNLIISLNLSLSNMTDGNVSAFILKELSSRNIAEQIIFEILEDESIKDLSRVKGFIDKVRSFGSKIAIDDFGSGYSNFFNVLKLVPDYIKIDGSIIRHVDRDVNSAIMVEAIVWFAKKLGMKTIAEYVRSEEIFEICKKCGVDEFQGFYLGEPKGYFLDEAREK